MFGLWFSITGMVPGIICSYMAKKKNRTQKNWYMLGQLLPVISIIIISMLSSHSSTSKINNKSLDNDSIENEYHHSIMNLS